MTRSLLLFTLVAGVLASRAAAQEVHGDVELLGQVYGTRPPAAYYALKERQPDAFQLRSGWMRRLPGTLAPAPSGGGAAPLSGLAKVLGPRGAAVEGTFQFPLVLGLFSDSPEFPPFVRSSIQTEFFDGPNSYYKTIPEFYDELSGGKVRLLGHTHGWARTTLTQGQVTANQSALPGRVGDFVLQIVAQLDDGSIDWGVFDNDGPDGVPNSGDDDGFVDILAVMHPTAGAECDGSSNRIWSHKWNLQSATGQTYVTRSQSARGGLVRIDDYTIQPSYACGGVRINQIGVFAHELGHAFGLPDLYCTSGSCPHSGIGRWGLMGSGAWGCAPPPSNRPDRPCPMSAWEKAMLGWVEVEHLALDADLGRLSLGPVAATQRVLRVDAADGSGNYFLLENRQATGFDEQIPAAGMLVWRIDESVLGSRWSQNTVNSDRNRMGVLLVQADGRNDLGTLRCAVNCGDAGDPFPGSTNAVALHTGSTPSTRTSLGSASGLTLLDIAREGPDIGFRALTRFQRLQLRTAGSSAAGATGLLMVDGEPVPGTETTLRAAPFQTLAIAAAPGVPVAEGVRFGFERWTDGVGVARARTFQVGLEDAELVALYGDRREVRLRMSIDGDQFGVAAGRVATAPESSDLWFTEGTPVGLTAAPTTGFGFVRWTGALEGRPNPTHLEMNGPVDAGAVFELTYRVGGELRPRVPAASPLELALVTENGTAPFVWTLLAGKLPEGVAFRSDGVFIGAALESGSFPLTVQAEDGSGLRGVAELTLEVGRPEVGVQSLVGFFLGNPGTLTELHQSYLDRAGNRNGSYDLGDMRAFFLANRDLPMTAEQRALVRMLVPAVTIGGGGK